MKAERSAVIFTAALLAFVTALGTVGCLYTAFDLTLEFPGRLLLICGGAALISAVLLSFRHGGTLLLCLLAVLGGYIYHDGRAAAQTLQLIQRLCTIYDRAYGWGVPDLTADAWNAGFVDWPLGLLAMAAAMAVSLSICCRKTVWLPMAAVLLPLSSCIVVTDTVPGEIWLLMVLTGLILLLLTAYVRRENPVQGIRLLGMAALPVTAALLALFLVVPMEGYVNQSEVFRENVITAVQNLPQLMETGLGSAASGLQRQPPKQVDLKNLGPRIPFTYPVMTVTAEQSGTLYLRGQDYDQYDGFGWVSSEDREEVFSRQEGPAGQITIHTENRKDIRYLPYYPAEEVLLRGGCGDNPERAARYTVLQRTLPENWRQRAYENANADPKWEAYTALSEETRKGAESLLSGLYGSAASHTEKADLIAALVTDSARYDRNPAGMPEGEGDFALWFLREGESGYCVHFATAAAVLLRAAEVPARYVTGYMLEAEAGKPVTVTEENAHAWAEYYEPNLDAWIPLEATPAQEEAVLPRPVATEETMPVPTESEESETVTETTLPPQTTAPTVPEVLPDMPEEEPKGPEIPWKWLLSTVFLVLLVALQRSARLKFRRRWQRTGDSNTQALRRWQEAVRLSRLLKDSPTEELMVLAQKAKFSQYEISQEELQRFDSFSRSCLRRLKQKPWYLQWLYRYVYAVY